MRVCSNAYTMDKVVMISNATAWQNNLKNEILKWMFTLMINVFNNIYCLFTI